MELVNTKKNIEDIKIQHQNEMNHLKSKMNRQIEDTLEDEKHAMQLSNEELQNKMKKLQVKNEQLQMLTKKTKLADMRQSQFCNQQIAYLGMQYIETVEPAHKADKTKFIQKQMDNAYHF